MPIEVRDVIEPFRLPDASSSNVSASPAPVVWTRLRVIGKPGAGLPAGQQPAEAAMSAGKRHDHWRRLISARFQRLGGHRESGRLTLINEWASWCAPCRVEMPALDSLSREFETKPGFRFMTINEDVRVDDARRFMAQFGFNFPVLLGRGRLKADLHYPVLPYTILVDADGRVVQKWIGYAGSDQLRSIRQAIAPYPLRGTVYGLAPYLLAQVAVMPMMGMPLFSGSTPLALGSLVGHLMYGTTIGIVYGTGTEAHGVHRPVAA